MTPPPTRLLLLLGLVVALVTGLLGMHTVTSATSHAMEAPSAAAGAVPMPALSVVNGGSALATQAPLAALDAFFTDAPAPAPGMAGLTCVLALLTGWMLLAAVASRSRAPIPTPRFLPNPVLFAVAVAKVRRPPDLTALSISRT